MIHISVWPCCTPITLRHISLLSGHINNFIFVSLAESCKMQVMSFPRQFIMIVLNLWKNLNLLFVCMFFVVTSISTICMDISPMATWLIFCNRIWIDHYLLSAFMCCVSVVNSMFIWWIWQKTIIGHIYAVHERQSIATLKK